MHLLFTQVHLLNDSSVEGQYITLVNFFPPNVLKQNAENVQTDNFKHPHHWNNIKIVTT